MKQIRIEKFGPPAQVARCVELPDVGLPQAWEVVVDVLAAAINPSDTAILAGRYGKQPPLPATPGMEGVARVVQRGAAVRTLAIGDHVLLLANDNWTQRRRMPEAALYKLPPGIDLLQAAMLKVNPATALMLLRGSPPLARGDWVLQTAPLGSVGRAVLQIARRLGLRTLNVVRRETAVDEVLALGGDVALQDGPGLAKAVAVATRGAPPRMALDAVGGAGIERLADSLERGGVIVNYGMLAPEALALRADQAVFKGITLKGFWLADLLARMTAAQRIELFDTLVALLAAGHLHGEVAGTYALDDIAAALRHAEQAGRSGKVLLLPHGPLLAASADR